MHDKSESLLLRLDQSIALMAEMRTPDPASAAAHDALKQARALIARALDREQAVIAQGAAARRAA